MIKERFPGHFPDK